MPTFCANCGTNTGGGRFCPKCGSSQAAMPSAYPPVHKKSPVVKIVLSVLAVLFLLFVAGAVRGYYFMKDRLQEAKQEFAKEGNHPARPTQAGCDLLGKDKVTDILGVTVVRTEGNAPGEAREFCRYYREGTTSDEKTSDADAKDLQSIAKKISEATSHLPLLTLDVYRGNAAGALIGLKTVGRIAGADETSVKGPWDEAYFGPLDSTFAIRKGDSGFTLTLNRSNQEREAFLEIAKATIVNLNEQR